MDLPRFLREPPADVLGILHDGFFESAQRGRHGCGRRTRRGDSRQLLRRWSTLVAPRGHDSGRHRQFADFRGCAQRASHGARARLLIVVGNTPEPAFELVAVSAAQAVLDHLFSYGLERRYPLLDDGEYSVMRQRWDFAPDFVNTLRIDVADHDARLRSAFA